MDVNMIKPPPGLNPNGIAYLVYNDKKPLPQPLVIPSFDFSDDVVLIPADHMPLLEPVDQRIVMTSGWTNINGIQSNLTYLTQSVPTLSAFPEHHLLTPRVRPHLPPRLHRRAHPQQPPPLKPPRAHRPSHPAL
ncbi:MAG: hypothetical protein Q9214_001114 [Letrouitia sp. 1 TL-2023]